MSWVAEIPVKQWPAALVLAVCAALCSGFAQLELRRLNATYSGVIALINAQLATLLTIPALSPPLVTGISGVSMLIVLAVNYLSTADKLDCCFNVSGVLIVAGIMLMMIDVSLDSSPSTHTAPQWLYTMFIALAALNTAAGIACSMAIASSVARHVIRICAGFHDAVTTSIVYMVFAREGDIKFLALLPFSGLFGIFLTRTSLTVNSIAFHMPIAFVAYNLAIWFAAPAVTSMNVHATGLSIAGAAICTLAVVPLLATIPAASKAHAKDSVRRPA